LKELLGISIVFDGLPSTGVQSTPPRPAISHVKPVEAFVGSDLTDMPKPPYPISQSNPEWLKLIEKCNQNKSKPKVSGKGKATSDTLRRSMRNKGSSTSI